MHLLFMLLIWLGAGVVLCLLTGPLMGAGSRRRSPRSVHPAARPSVRAATHPSATSFAVVDLDEWIRRADQLARHGLSGFVTPEAKIRGPFEARGN